VSVFVCVVSMGLGLIAAEPVARVFGFGGAMATAFLPDTTGVNAFLSENGLAPMGDFLVGAGGGGRGGVIGGPVFGGIGWGAFASSENDELRAEWLFGGGGFDVGCAVGGDRNSVLTVGVVLGGGASILTVDGYLVQTVAPEGVVAEPTTREVGVGMGFVQPYVSMAAQLLPWMGFEFRLGYVIPVFEVEFGDDLGVPAPSLEFSGPSVSVGLMFGGISSGLKPAAKAEGGNEPISIVDDGGITVAAGAELIIENGFGDIAIASYDVEETETSSDLVVEWQATRTAKEERIHELQVVSSADGESTMVQTLGLGRVDYALRIPTGIDLKVKNGAGNVTVTGHEATTIIVENGAGEIELRDVGAAALIVAGGVGKIALPSVEAHHLIVELGVGEIDLVLPASASATLTARAGLGDVEIDRFPGMIGGTRGFLGRAADVTLGAGERVVELHVGLGRIGVEMLEP